MQIDSIKWKSQFPSRGVSAKVAYETLESIREKSGGSLTDDVVVAAAKSKRSAIHNLFEWDDTKAAEEHRRSQARTLIRAIEVTYKETPKSPVRAFQVMQKVSAKEQERTSYSTTEAVMSDPVSRDQLIATAIREAMAFRRRFKHLHELRPLFDALDQVIETAGLEQVAS